MTYEEIEAKLIENEKHSKECKHCKLLELKSVNIAKKNEEIQTRKDWVLTQNLTKNFNALLLLDSDSTIEELNVPYSRSLEGCEKFVCQNCGKYKYRNYYEYSR